MEPRRKFQMKPSSNQNKKKKNKKYIAGQGRMAKEMVQKKREK